jgi:aminomuconate-semialdehyde/2-hydroxymuconate-6-semialdehyde dehydrogenase
MAEAIVERGGVINKVIELKNFIGGKFVDSVSGKKFESRYPATNEIIATVPESGREDVEMAVESAVKAFKVWSKMPVKERSKYLMRISELIMEKLDELAYLESIDVGKPIRLARSMEIPRASYNFSFFAEFAKYVHTEFYETDDRGAINYVLRRPVGVAGLITPWNLPLLLTTWKVAPCLAAGNTCIIKPSELTPITATKLAEIAAEAGLPDGVLNVVHGFGPNSAGEFIVSHPEVKLISLTGETTTGQAIMRTASQHLKKLSFELGGKNPNIIFADADLEQALDVTIQSSFSNQGEVCLCGSRIYVERKIYDEFVDKLVERAKKVKVGDPLDPETDMGALISEEHLHKVRTYLEMAEADGGKILTGGKTPENLPEKFKSGNWLEPTVIVGLNDNCRVIKEEIFGPVVTVSPFDTEEEVIERANNTHYGLSATIWTRDLTRAHRVAGQIEAGVIWINTWFLRDLRTPFGGMKMSGIGREGGIYSFEFYTELKNVCIKL